MDEDHSARLVLQPRDGTRRILRIRVSNGTCRKKSTENTFCPAAPDGDEGVVRRSRAFCTHPRVGRTNSGQRPAFTCLLRASLRGTDSWHVNQTSASRWVARCLSRRSRQGGLKFLSPRKAAFVVSQTISVPGDLVSSKELRLLAS